MVVNVIDAPGYEDFEGVLLMEVPRVDGVMVSVVGRECDHCEPTREIHVIESTYVHPVPA